jgi:hypothetical protein
MTLPLTSSTALSSNNLFTKFTILVKIISANPNNCAELLVKASSFPKISSHIPLTDTPKIVRMKSFTNRQLPGSSLSLSKRRPPKKRLFFTEVMRNRRNECRMFRWCFKIKAYCSKTMNSFPHFPEWCASTHLRSSWSRANNGTCSSVNMCWLSGRIIGRWPSAYPAALRHA